MMASSPPWLRRSAAIGLLVAILLAVYGIVVGPILAAYSRVDEAIAETEELLARYQQIAAQRDALASQLAQLATRQTRSGIYLPGETDALAAAQLQDIVNRTIDGGGGRLRSVQILPSQSDGDFRRVGVRVQMTATIASLARILYTFEAGDTFLFIDSVDVSNRQARRRRNATAEQDPELLVRLDLSGYVRPEVAG